MGALRELRALDGQGRFLGLLHGRLWLCVLDLLLLGNALVIAVLVLGLGIHAGQISGGVGVVAVDGDGTKSGLGEWVSTRRAVSSNRTRKGENA